MGQHGIGDFQEAGDIGANHQIALITKILGSCTGISIDIDHNVFEFSIDFFKSPGIPHAVLGHFQGGSSYTTGIGGFARSKENFVGVEHLNSFRS